MQKGGVRIKEGYVILYFCFDIANEIALDKLEKIFGQKPTKEELRLARIAPKYIQYRSPPIYIKLPQRSVSKQKFSVDVKIYDFGTVTLRYRLPVQCTIAELRRYGYEFIDDQELEKDAYALLEKIKKEIADSLVSPGETSMENYLFYYVANFTTAMSASKLQQTSWRDIAAAVSCEQKALSEQELKDSAKEALSYYPNDMVIVGWNAAFVYDPTHSYETLDVIEYSVIELLELRTYDELLDKTLDAAYDDIAIHQKHFFFDPSLNKIISTLSSTRLEVMDVIDKVENGLKLFGDLYLVNIYNLAATRFGLERWKDSVKSKLQTVMETYSMLSDQLNSRRFILLETMIVGLFVLDIILLYLLG